MKKLDWIESARGPLIIISDDAIKFWGGIYKREPYLFDKFEDADDFMDSSETDYGKACLVDDFLGAVEVGNGNGLVLNDEPMPTTIFYKSNREIRIARFCYYGIKGAEHYADNLLLDLDIASIDYWEYKLTINFNSDTQFLFDSAIDGQKLNNQKVNIDFLISNLNKGQYKVFSTTYNPKQEIKLLMHRFVLDN